MDDAPDNKFRGGRPFDAPPGNGAPAAVQKFMYVILQRAVYENAAAHEYFASRGSRTWTSAAAMKSANKRLHADEDFGQLRAGRVTTENEENSHGSPVYFYKQSQKYYCKRVFTPDGKKVIKQGEEDGSSHKRSGGSGGDKAGKHRPFTAVGGSITAFEEGPKVCSKYGHSWRCASCVAYLEDKLSHAKAQRGVARDERRAMELCE